MAERIDEKVGHLGDAFYRVAGILRTLQDLPAEHRPVLAKVALERFDQVAADVAAVRAELEHEAM